jgi:fluoroacetyl-CoA thioesterase
MNLEVGLKHTVEMVVEQKDTAAAFGSGNVLVLATPMMVTLMENAALKAVEQALPEGSTTVGTHLEVSHKAATPLGMKARAEAELIEMKGKKLIFKVTAYDECEMIGEGTHIRYIVSIDQFLENTNKKSKAIVK